MWFGRSDATCTLWNLCICPCVVPIACLQRSPCCCVCCAVCPRTDCYLGPTPEVVERLVEPK